MIDHKIIQDDKFYECSECKSIVYGKYLDWFEDEPKLIICPICRNRCEFVDVDKEIKDLIGERTPTSDEADEYMEMDAMNE